jgi:PKD repeat protein
VPPSTDFSGTPLVGVEPLVVAFSDLSGHGPLSWLWSFGDSNGSAAQQPSHLYEDPGTFAVSLIASNDNGPFTTTKNPYITVTACEHQPVSLLPDYYPSLQEAYDTSENDDTIRSRAKLLTGNLVLGKKQIVHISGGYDCQHDKVVGVTTLKGKLTVKSGKVIVKQLVIR